MGYRPRHAKSNLRMKFAAVAAAALATAGFGIAQALPASAATLTCTNVANAVNSPFGCGGLKSGTGLALAHVSNFYNGLVTAQSDGSSSSLDWTAFAIVPPTVLPHTLGGHITGGDGYGVYVAMDTPGGILPGFTSTVSSPVTCMVQVQPVTHDPGATYTNTEPCPGETFQASPADLCLSVEHAAHVPGTNGRLRWWDVLRSCNTNGGFTYGEPATSESPGAPGTVSFFNPYQAWEPQGPGANGFIMNNVWLFQHNNVPYVLDVTGDGGPGAAVQAFPLHTPGTDSAVAWEEWNVIGCTPPASLLDTHPPYVNCP